MMYLVILLVLAAASVREAEPHNVPRPPGVYWDGWKWRDDRGLDLDTGAGAVTNIHIYGSQLGSQGSSVMMMYFIMSKESSSLTKSETTTITTTTATTIPGTALLNDTAQSAQYGQYEDANFVLTDCYFSAPHHRGSR